MVHSRLFKANDHDYLLDTQVQDKHDMVGHWTRNYYLIFTDDDGIRYMLKNFSHKSSQGSTSTNSLKKTEGNEQEDI